MTLPSRFQNDLNNNSNVLRLLPARTDKTKRFSPRPEFTVRRFELLLHPKNTFYGDSLLVSKCLMLPSTACVIAVLSFCSLKVDVCASVSGVGIPYPLGERTIPLPSSSHMELYS